MRPTQLTVITVLLLLLGAGPARGQLLVHLTFDNAADLTADASGNDHRPGFVQGALTAATGVSGGGAVFDGNTYLRWGSGGAVVGALKGSFTAAVWIRTTQTFGSAGDRGYEGVGIVYADQPGQTTDTIPIALNGSVAGFLTSDGVQDTTIHSSSSISTGSYVHVAVTYDHATGRKRVYVNGALEATELVAPTAHDARGLLFLGANDFDSRYFSGQLDDFQFYAQALSATEVSQLFSQPGLTAIPEPGVLPLIALGLAALVLQHRRREFRRDRSGHASVRARRTSRQGKK